MMTSRSTCDPVWREYGRVMVAVALNIIRETPPHLTPRRFTANLIAVLRHPQSPEKPTVDDGLEVGAGVKPEVWPPGGGGGKQQRQREKVTVGRRRKKGTQPAPSPQFFDPPHTGFALDANDGGVSGTASKSTERLPTTSVTTKRKSVKGGKDRHADASRPSVCISVKPLEKLTNFTQKGLVEDDCVDVQDASGARQTATSEAYVIRDKQFLNTSSYKALGIEGFGDVQKENLIPIPPGKQKVPLDYKNRITCNINDKRDEGKLNSVVIITPRTSPESRVVSLDSTFQTSPDKGRTEDHVSSQRMIDLTNDDCRSLYAEIQNVPVRLCVPSTSVHQASVLISESCRNISSTHVPNVSSNCNNSGDSSTGSGGADTKVNTTDGPCSVIPDTDARNTFTRDKPTSATYQGNKDNDDLRSRKETVDDDTSVTPDDTNTVSGRQNRGDGANIDSCIATSNLEIGKVNTSRRTHTADGYIGDIDEGCGSRNGEGDSGSSVIDCGRDDQMSSRCEVRAYDVALREVRQEVEAGLDAASRATQHNWSNCYRSLKEVKVALFEAPGVGRGEEDLCLAFLTEVLTMLLRTGPVLAPHSPTHWWLALEAVESVVVAVSTWSPLLVRAGNLLLQALIFICHKINYRIAGREYLAEIAYYIAAAITRVVIAACSTLEQEAPTTAATSEFSESFTFSEQPSIEAALAVLDPGVDMNYMSESSWATFNDVGILYSGPSSAAPPAEEITGEECQFQCRKAPQTLVAGKPRGRDGTNVDVVLNSDQVPKRTTGPTIGETARRDVITAALDALAPYSRRRDTTQPLLKKPRTATQEEHPANSPNSPDSANVEWNLLYWRSVIREECEPHADFLPMFGLQITEIIRIIDRCCG